MFIIKIILTPLSGNIESISGVTMWMGKNYSPAIIDGNLPNFTRQYGFENREDIDANKGASIIHSLSKIFENNYSVNWIINPMWL